MHGSPQPRAKISASTVRVTMEKSFRMWKDASKLSFRRLADNVNSADIIVKFGVGNHGDFYPFDGRSGTLAHAFYPGSNTGKYTCRIVLVWFHFVGSLSLVFYITRLLLVA